MRKRAKTVFDQFWHVIQICNLGNGEFRIWALIGDELHPMTVTVPRVFYVNRKNPKSKETGPVWRRVTGKFFFFYFVTKYHVRFFRF